MHTHAHTHTHTHTHMPAHLQMCMHAHTYTYTLSHISHFYLFFKVKNRSTSRILFLQLVGWTQIQRDLSHRTDKKCDCVWCVRVCVCVCVCVCVPLPLLIGIMLSQILFVFLVLHHWILHYFLLFLQTLTSSHYPKSPFNYSKSEAWNHWN